MLDPSDDRGVTALQTMVVIVIMGVLVYLALPIWGQLVERAKAMTCQQNQRNIAQAIALAKTDGVVSAYVGYYDGLLDVGTPWGRVLIPQYLSKPPKCPAKGGGLYNMSPFGKIWSDKGAGQYVWTNQGTENDHQLKSQ